MYCYKSYLDKKNEQMKKAHRQSSIKRVVSDVLELCTIQPSTITYTFIDESYRCIEEALCDKGYYHAICLNNLAPTDRY